MVGIITIYAVSREKGDNLEVTVQADKNYRICDVFFNFTVDNEKTLRNRILNEFIGRQFNDISVQTHLFNVLNELLN